jgi:lipopolysaccharide heptosyltransferase I
MSDRKRILVIKLSSFGDIFHALPTVNNLKVALDAEIDWVTQPEYVELVRCFPIVSNVIHFPRREFLSRGRAFIRDLRSRKYSMVIDLQGLLKSAVVARLARGDKTIGPSFQREGACLFYDAVAAPRDKNRHAVDENLDVVRYLGLPVIPAAFPVVFPEQVMDAPAPRVAIVPVSRRHNKNWPVENFTQTARALRQEFGASIFLFGSMGDQGVCEAIRSDLMAQGGPGDVVNLAGKTSLVEMGGWFSKMNLVVVNDSGPLHMAAALGVPLVTMFGPTDPLRTGPYGGNHRVLTTGVACRPCFDKVCKFAHVECMNLITAKEVIAAAQEELNKAK